MDDGSSPKRGCNSSATPDPLWYVPTPREPQLIGLSSAGDVRWLRNYSFHGTGGMVSVFRNDDGTLNAVTRMGELWYLHPNGSVISNRSINSIFWISSAIKTHDGGFLSLDYPSSGTIEIKKDDMNETFQWKNDEIKKSPWRIKKVIQTSDDDFVIMGAVKKMPKCKFFKMVKKPLNELFTIVDCELCPVALAYRTHKTGSFIR